MIWRVTSTGYLARFFGPSNPFPMPAQEASSSIEGGTEGSALEKGLSRGFQPDVTYVDPNTMPMYIYVSAVAPQSFDKPGITRVTDISVISEPVSLQSDLSGPQASISEDNPLRTPTANSVSIRSDSEFTKSSKMSRSSSSIFSRRSFSKPVSRARSTIRSLIRRSSENSIMQDDESTQSKDNYSGSSVASSTPMEGAGDSSTGSSIYSAGTHSTTTTGQSGQGRDNEMDRDPPNSKAGLHLGGKKLPPWLRRRRLQRTSLKA